MPSNAYRDWVYRVWDALERHTQRTVFPLDQRHLAAYCPVCFEGTIRVQFIRAPEPSIRITSNDRPDHCSHGCAAERVGEALFA